MGQFFGSYFVSSLDQNEEVKIIMSLILHLDTTPAKFKIQIMKYIFEVNYWLIFRPISVQLADGPHILGQGRGDNMC